MLGAQWLGDLPLWNVAENGIYYRLGGRSVEWQSEFENIDDSWIGSITPVFRYFEERTPGSVTETQEHSITWHYREADEDFGEIQASVLQEHLEKVLGNQPVEVSLDSKQVQVRPYAVSKGAVLEPLMEACTEYRRPSKGDALAMEERDSNTLPPITPIELSAVVGGATGGIADHVTLNATRNATATMPVASASPAMMGLPSVVGSGSGSAERSSFMGHKSAERSVEPSEWGGQPLDFILCIGCHNARDEDVFGNLESRDVDDAPYAEHLPETIWTCRVGENPTQVLHRAPCIILLCAVSHSACLIRHNAPCRL